MTQDFAFTMAIAAAAPPRRAATAGLLGILPADNVEVEFIDVSPAY